MRRRRDSARPSRSRVRVVLACGALVASSAGCPALLSDPFRIGADAGGTDGAGPDATLSGDATALLEATAPDAPDEGDALLADATTDAEVDAEADASSVRSDAGACCSLTSRDPLDTATFDHWVPRGTVRSFPGFVELTPDQTEQAGGLFAGAAEALSDFEIAFEFSITKTADGGLFPADGLAFVALPKIPAGCEEGGSSLCVLGMDGGVAVVVRTFMSGLEPAAPYVAVLDTARSLIDDAGPLIVDGAIGYPEASVVTYVPTTLDADPPDASWQTLCIRFNGRKATVKLGAERLFSDVPLSASVPASARWGFVGATGALSERNAIRNVRWFSSSTCGDAARCADAGLCGP